MPEDKTGVLLLQLGTPDSPSTSDVRKYLSEFLTDWRVIDIPWLGRQILVKGIIAPIRAPKSAKLYRNIWTEKGSPLLIYGMEVKKKLQTSLGENYVVEFGMRYQNPPLKIALENLKKAGVRKLIVFPLFPQFASSSTGSALELLFREMAEWQFIPDIKVHSSYYDHPGFTTLWADKARQMNPDNYDKVMFTFHGVPWRHIRKSGCSVMSSCKGLTQETPHECPAITDENYTCYRAQCFASARAVIEKLGLENEKAIITFQSRLGNDPWLTPYTDKTLIRLAGEGKKRILVFSMSFVADCLETIYEVGKEYNDLFIEHGGEKVQLIPSLNSDEGWIKFIHQSVTGEV